MLSAEIYPAGFALAGAADFDGQAQGQAGILFAEADVKLLGLAVGGADLRAFGVGNGDIGQRLLIEPGGEEGAEFFA